MKLIVLAIDDNPVNLKLVAELLRQAGHVVLCAEDACAALQLLETHLPDVVLTDISMPGMDGLQLTQHLKADARLRHLPVIALTASAMKGDEARILKAGCDGYISKPFDTRLFPAQVEDVVARAATVPSA
jgi:CheY-like chemotaxis protein